MEMHPINEKKMVTLEVKFEFNINGIVHNITVLGVLLLLF